jgi:hypothetical protein
MLWGRPICRSCGYQGPDHMWMTHGQGFGVLIQDRQTYALRVSWVPDLPDEQIETLRTLSESEGEQAYIQYVASCADPPLSPTERVVLRSESIGAVMNHDSRSGPTQLPCPQCRSRLDWEHTGIS